MSAVRRRTHYIGARGHIPRGFTLIELMVAIMVLAILLGVAVPSFRDAALGSRLTAYANDLVASAQIARSEAIKRNAPVRLCVSAGGAACEDGSWEVGWIVVTAGGEVLQRQQSISGDFRFLEAGGADEITFPATVVGVTPASFTVCRATPVGNQERVVTISASGSASVVRTTDGACPAAVVVDEGEEDEG
jgi:type IV fimbrial biogenesis protein FimT